MSPTTTQATIIGKLIERAHAVMTERRLLHVLGVTHVTVTLAARHGLSTVAAALAGLLHDQSKHLAPETIEAELRAMGEAIPAEDREHPRVWHGLHAAAWARRELGVEDEALLEAVALHTTADAGVGPLTQALYIGDSCEPGRHNPHAGEILAAARERLEDGFRQALIHKTRHVAHKRGELHARSLRALEAWVDEAERARLRAEKTIRT